MPIQQERRESERVSCRLGCPYELTKPVDSSTVKFSEGNGHAINRSVRGLLLLLPEEVDHRQVIEVQVPSEASKEQTTKLVEVCWTRAIQVNSRVNIHLIGTRFLFEVPASGWSP